MTLTNKIKSALLNYYVFQRGSYLVCTEIWDGFGIADVIVSHKKIITEVEIKISYADLKNELKKTKERYDFIENRIRNYTKHDIFDSPNHPFPNKYYFCVPTELVEKAIIFANKINPKYGVIEFNHKTIKRSIKIVKPAKMIHTIDNSINYERRMIDRICNDLTQKYYLLYWK